MNGKIHKFTVLPKLPDNLKPLLEIAYNLWWSWNPEAVDLFRLTDQNLWDEVKHNPVKMLGVIGNEKLQKLSEDEAFISHMINVYNSFLMYKEYSTWYSKNLKKELLNIAYFSMEFGLHDSLPIYSGGLGVLSGCHIKSSSDIGIPLIGIGLLYSYGNFNQYLSSDGWQLEKYKENDFSNLPAKLIDGLIVDIPVGNETVYARVWKIDVGRVSIYFLDTNFHKNSLENRKITNYLYVGDRDTRIKQEKKHTKTQPHMEHSYCVRKTIKLKLDLKPIVVILKTNTYKGSAPLTIKFDGSASYITNKNDSIAFFNWDF
jgi:starch phosphorylase